MKTTLQITGPLYIITEYLDGMIIAIHTFDDARQAREYLAR